MTDFENARQTMVESQIRPGHLSGPTVLTAIAATPRELFLPESSRSCAYADAEQPLPGGRSLMTPRVFARLIDAAEISPSCVVLDIGCGTGYSTAVLARLAETVVAVESDPELAASATETLGALNIDNAAVVTAPLSQGYPGQGPYNVIVLGGAVSSVPAALFDQLGEGGRLAAIIDGSENNSESRACIFTRRGGDVSHREVFDAHARRLPGFDQPQGFVFR